MLSDAIPSLPVPEEIPVVLQEATVDDAEANHCLELIRARPLVQRRIAEGTSYPRNTITRLVTQDLNRKASDHRVIAVVDFICKEFVRQGLTIVLTIGTRRTSDEEHKEKSRRTVQKRQEDNRRRLSGLRAEANANDAPEAGLGASDDFFDIDEVDGYLAMSIDPVKPTQARPGSEEKVLMLSARYSAGLPLWHDKDCYEHGPAESELMGFDPDIRRLVVQGEDVDDPEDENDTIGLAAEDELDDALDKVEAADLAV